MTTHQGHDHPNTKAARAACRRAALQGNEPKTTKQASQERHPAGKAAGTPAKVKARKGTAKYVDPSMPHAYDEDMEKAKRCYICKRAAGASVHTEGPRDLGQLLTFGR